MAMVSPVFSIADFERLAEQRLDPGTAAYLLGGSGDEITLRRNREAFDSLSLRPRMLADLRGASTEITLLARSYPTPILLGPVAHQCLFAEEGECLSAMAAAAMEMPYVISTLASRRYEEIVQAGEGQEQWFQLYWQQTRARTAALLKRVAALDVAALVFTLDAPVNALRNREQRTGFVLPPHARAMNIDDPQRAPVDGRHRVFDVLMAEAPRWEDLDWLRREWRKPLLVKGILCREDALRALEAGDDGIIVSNHGGRVLDGAAASIAALPEIAAAVAGRVPILLDSGIRRGSDVLKAIALGANAVLVGRAYATALAAGGVRGVVQALKILSEELAVAMALTGCRSLCRLRGETDFASLIQQERL